MNLQRTNLSLSRLDSSSSGGYQVRNLASSVCTRLGIGFNKLARSLRQSASGKIKLMDKIQNVTDEWLRRLCVMPKMVTTPRARWTQKNPRHKQRKFLLCGTKEEDKKFSIFLRQSITHSNNFSCGIEFTSGVHSEVRLARYNGPGHVRRNGPEHAHPVIRFRPHIHRASEKAYLQGKKLDAFAEETDRFVTLHWCVAVSGRRL